MATHRVQGVPENICTGPWTWIKAVTFPRTVNAMKTDNRFLEGQDESCIVHKCLNTGLLNNIVCVIKELISPSLIIFSRISKPLLVKHNKKCKSHIAPEWQRSLNKNAHHFEMPWTLMLLTYVSALCLTVYNCVIPMFQWQVWLYKPNFIAEFKSYFDRYRPKGDVNRERQVNPNSSLLFLTAWQFSALVL